MSERANALNEFYQSSIEEMRSLVPAESDRPTVGVLNAMNNPETEAGNFGVYDPYTRFDKTYGQKQYHEMDVVDAFASEYGGESGTNVDWRGCSRLTPK